MGVLKELIASAKPYIKRPHIRYIGGQWICSNRGTHVGMGWGPTPYQAYYAWWSKSQGSRNTHA